MPSSLPIFLSLLGGYLFIHFCFRFHFRAQALDGHRLIFESAVAGFILFVPSRALALLLQKHVPGLRNFWYALSGHVPYLGTLVITVLLSVCAAFTWNFFEGYLALSKERNSAEEFDFKVKEILFAGREHVLGWAVHKWGDHLQILLYEAAKRTLGEDSALVCLITKDRKAYVGWITGSPNLRANDTYVSFVPLMSGYRDKDTLSLKFIVFYPVEREEEIVLTAEKVVEHDGDILVPYENFVTTLPVSEIVTARRFDLDFYNEVFLEQAESLED
jgi:hypothetical protein